jgi:hypothetical protein
MAAPGMAPMIPPPEGNKNRGPDLIAMFWMESVFCIMILALRLYVRISIRGLGIDDWLMLFTVVCRFKPLQNHWSDSSRYCLS